MRRAVDRSDAHPTEAYRYTSNEIGQNLQRYRLLAGMTQEELLTLGFAFSRTQRIMDIPAHQKKSVPR